MANEDVNIAYLNDEEARTADMRQMKEQIMRMLARSRDLQIGQLGKQLVGLYDYYEQAEQEALRRWRRSMLLARERPPPETPAGGDPGAGALDDALRHGL